MSFQFDKDEIAIAYKNHDGATRFIIPYQITDNLESFLRKLHCEPVD